MGDKSKIEWTDATWNPVRGCTRVSEGCRNCYAEIMAARFCDPGMWGHGFAERRAGDHRWTGKVELVGNKLTLPLHWNRPRRIFVNSTSDLFHESLTHAMRDRVFDIIDRPPCERHIFQILTKRPAIARDYMLSRFPEKPPGNVWLGVSVEDQATAFARIPILLDTPAAIRFISAEPLLGPLLLWHPAIRDAAGEAARRCSIDWVITGGESGPGARPCHPDWIRSLRDQCDAAAVPFFFKQWGSWSPVCAQYPANDHEHDEAELASMVGDITIDDSGTILDDDAQPRTQGRPWLMDRADKKTAGAMLDGKLYREFPDLPGWPPPPWGRRAI